MRPIYAVILHVPDDALGDVPILRKGSGHYYLGATYPYDRLGLPTFAVHGKDAPFHVGEILLLNAPMGRELGWSGRSPSKWLVKERDYVIVRSFSEAVRLAHEAIEKYIGGEAKQ